MTLRRLLPALLLPALLLALSGPASAADGPSGYVDWERQVAVGVGKAPVRQNAMGATQARAMAQRAAMLDARRNLLEVVGQVRVDSASVVENFMTVSDKVTTTVQGLLAGATVAAERLRPDGTYELTLTIPLAGPLTREILAAGPSAGRPAAQPAAAPAEAPDPALANRLARTEAQTALLHSHAAQLEMRVAALERQGSSLPPAGEPGSAPAIQPVDGTQTGRMLQLEGRVSYLGSRLARLEARVAALELKGASQAAAEPAAFPGDGVLMNRLSQVESRLALYAGRVAQLETRVAALERNTPAKAVEAAAAPLASAPLPPAAQAAPPAPEPAPAAPEPAKAPAVAVPPGLAQAFTGLVVDARGTGFTPSLAPTFLEGKEQLYPGPAVDQAVAVRRGLVRYYRDLGKAQQSREVGATPKTVKAAAGSPGSLDLAPADAALLRAVLAQPGNFLDQCKVVVVF